MYYNKKKCEELMQERLVDPTYMVEDLVAFINEMVDTIVSEGYGDDVEDMINEWEEECDE